MDNHGFYSQNQILFKPEMVRAILDGAKVQTRRIMRPQPNIEAIDHFQNTAGAVWCGYMATGDPTVFKSTCPYGYVGCYLWVRESWTEKNGKVYYKADDPIAPKYHPWRPSIYMPKKYCRLWLRVENVRVERVQDITAVDAIDEGVLRMSTNWLHSAFPEYARDFIEWRDRGAVNEAPPLGPSPRNRFIKLWDQINAAGGFDWEKNPWVWVVEFKKDNDYAAV